MSRHRFTMLATAAAVPVTLFALAGCSSATKASGLGAVTQTTGGSASSAAVGAPTTPAATGSSSPTTDSGTDSSTDADTSATDASSSDDASTDANTEAGTDASTTADTASSAPGSSGDSAAFCTSFKTAIHDFDLFTGKDPSVSVGQVQTELQTAQNSAPGAIKSDVTLIIAFYQSALTQGGKDGMTPELGPAEQRYGTWSKANCTGA